MNNEKYWDNLFDKINKMSDEEFNMLILELDETEDIPFAIY